MRTLPHNFQDGPEEAPTGLAPSLTPDTLVSLSLSLWGFFCALWILVCGEYTKASPLPHTLTLVISSDP